MNYRTVIGRAEQVSFPKLGAIDVTAKVDTGADISSVWASAISETDQGLSFCLFGEGNPHYTGELFHHAERSHAYGGGRRVWCA